MLGKHVIRSQDRAGFVVNALLIPYLLSAIRMMECGFATAEDIDAGMVHGCAHPMGPLALTDLIGLDTTMAVAESMYTEFKEPLYAPPPLLSRMVEAGLLGRKTGRGFFNYREVGMSELHVPEHPVRFVTAASLFDGHDASINIMRRILQAQGAEVIHLGHNRSRRRGRRAAVQEDVQGVAISSYQGGHVEYFSTCVERLREAGRGPRQGVRRRRRRHRAERDRAARTRAASTDLLPAGRPAARPRRDGQPDDRRLRRRPAGRAGRTSTRLSRRRPARRWPGRSPRSRPAR